MIKVISRGDLVEWQTRWIQNPISQDVRVQVSWSLPKTTTLKKIIKKKFTEKDTKHFFVSFDLDIYLVTLDIHYRLNFLGSFDLDTFYGEVSKS